MDDGDDLAELSPISARLLTLKVYQSSVILYSFRIVFTEKE